MAIEVKVPILPESVADATVATWHKKAGDVVSRDENLVDIETDKVMLEVPAPEDGVLREIIKDNGSTVIGQELIAVIEAGAAANKPAAPAPANDAEDVSDADHLSPAVRRLLDEHKLDAADITGTGRGGRITRKDVTEHVQKQAAASSNKPAAVTREAVVAASPSDEGMGIRAEQRVPMTRLRKRIAERLVESQQNAAILSTFNEVDLAPIMAIRKKYQDQFVAKHGIKLGFMSFFIKAAVEALKKFPLVNASIDGDDVVYHGYFDVGVAVSTERGLVVPVIRDADKLNLGELEQKVAEYGAKARDGQLALEDMQGGTFTVSNGGVFGSLLSTPIINPPQSGILGMHKIQERPVAIDGQVVIRPMMYIALSYDHRIIDGKESVTFLRTIKEVLEDPTRLLLDI